MENVILKVINFGAVYFESLLVSHYSATADTKNKADDVPHFRLLK